MFRRLYEFLLIYFLVADIVFSDDFESLKARIDTIERQLNEGATKLEAFSEIIENLETSVNGTVKETLQENNELLKNLMTKMTENSGKIQQNQVSLQSSIAKTLTKTELVECLTIDRYYIDTSTKTNTTELVEVSKCLTLGENYKFIIDRCYYIDNSTETKTTELAEVSKCLTLGQYYKFIIDRCYYIDTSYKKLSDAKAQCNTVFRSIGRDGKIFEPVDTNTFNMIKKTAFALKESTYWIGFVRKDATNWKRISDGLPAPNLWGSNTQYLNENEPHMIFGTNNNWYDVIDRSSRRSICEVI